MTLTIEKAPDRSGARRPADRLCRYEESSRISGRIRSFLKLFYFLLLPVSRISSSRILRYSQITVNTRPKAALHSYSFA